MRLIHGNVLFSHVWQWYIAAVFAGIGTSCSMVVIPVVLNNWFRSRNGLVLGITMSSSGIAGALFSPLCSSLISAYGWRVTSVLMGAAGGILIIIPSLMILVADPEEVNGLPYYKERAPLCQKKSEKKDGTHTINAPARLLFSLSAVAILSVSSLTQFTFQIPTYADSLGLGLSIGAMMASYTMIGNVVGKLSIGLLADRIGIFRAIQSMIVLIAISMGIFLVGNTSMGLLYIGSFACGMVFSLMATAPSLLFVELYGKEHYRSRVSQLQAISGIIMAVLSAVFPFIYDWTGSFRPVFMYGLTACAISLVIFSALKQIAKKSVV